MAWRDAIKNAATAIIVADRDRRFAVDVSESESSEAVVLVAFTNAAILVVIRTSSARSCSISAVMLAMLADTGEEKLVRNDANNKIEYRRMITSYHTFEVEI